MIQWQSLQWQRDGFREGDSETRARLVRAWQENRDRALGMVEVRQKQNDEPAAKHHQEIADLWRWMLAWAEERSGAQQELFGSQP